MPWRREESLSKCPLRTEFQVFFKKLQNNSFMLWYHNCRQCLLRGLKLLHILEIEEDVFWSALSVKDLKKLHLLGAVIEGWRQYLQQN